ncbi:MAG TPA: lipocalin-like domain-containing protein [Candidatus Methylacidiphilales bacterium]|nr:lipocalin-like domain-containing protein [Candidatus Methylacidiphilales bacterium]
MPATLLIFRRHRSLLAMAAAVLHLSTPHLFAQADPPSGLIHPRVQPTAPSLTPAETPPAVVATPLDWKRAIGPRRWDFPADHGAHPDFKTEWWYFTGQLIEADSIDIKDIPTATPLRPPDPVATGATAPDDPDNLADIASGGSEYLRVDKVVGKQKEGGRRFGYQFTLFRHGVQKDPAQKSSKWAVRDVMFGHMAVADLVEKKFRFAEIVDRCVLGQGGASTKEMKAWIRGWRIETVGPEEYKLQAETPEFGMELVVRPIKKLVLQGTGGLSQKAPGEGNASYYYSYPRMMTAGRIRINAKQYLVSGESWFDHEFSTSSMGREQIGWDWFSIHLDNEEELMLYRMRRTDGATDSCNQGTLVRADGTIMTLGADDFTIENLATWKSPGTGGVYPSRWKISVPRAKLELESAADLPDQELRLKLLGPLSYWEGACTLKGMRDGKPVQGRGYTELTGYGSPMGTGMKE